MELIWKNSICAVIQDVRYVNFCDNLVKTIGKLWLENQFTVTVTVWPGQAPKDECN